MTNFGDAALFYDNPAARRETLTNRKSLNNTIFPNDIVHRERPSDPVKFAWVDKTDGDMIDSYTDESYQFVTDAEFDKVIPRWRWEQGKLCSGSVLALMWKPYLLAASDEEAARDSLQTRIDGADAKVHDIAADAGISTFETKLGKKVVDPKNRR